MILYQSHLLSLIKTGLNRIYKIKIVIIIIKGGKHEESKKNKSFG